MLRRFERLVARVVPQTNLMVEALGLAEKIASLSLPVVKALKQAVKAADEMPLSQGLRKERDLIHSLFALDDQKEGMAAFLEKRPANFKNR